LEIGYYGPGAFVLMVQAIGVLSIQSGEHFSHHGSADLSVDDGKGNMNKGKDKNQQQIYQPFALCYPSG
jgi:hypothetical protein